MNKTKELIYDIFEHLKDADIEILRDSSLYLRGTGDEKYIDIELEYETYTIKCIKTFSDTKEEN